MPIPVPTTPSTLSVTMLTVKTPPTPRGSSGACPVDKHNEPVKYSFEEVRHGFVHLKTYGHDLSLN